MLWDNNSYNNSYSHSSKLGFTNAYKSCSFTNGSYEGTWGICLSKSTHFSFFHLNSMLWDNNSYNNSYSRSSKLGFTNAYKSCSFTNGSYEGTWGICFSKSTHCSFFRLNIMLWDNNSYTNSYSRSSNFVSQMHTCSLTNGSYEGTWGICFSKSTHFSFICLNSMLWDNNSYNNSYSHSSKLGFTNAYM